MVLTRRAIASWFTAVVAAAQKRPAPPPGIGIGGAIFRIGMTEKECRDVLPRSIELYAYKDDGRFSVRAATSPFTSFGSLAFRDGRLISASKEFLQANLEKPSFDQIRQWTDRLADEADKDNRIDVIRADAVRVVTVKPNQSASTFEILFGEFEGTWHIALFEKIGR
ncbi:MAG: hypothetical protein NTZ56_09820 [Acidobacteria bacterium]|nr:hypothetical protein [Acidobacteriota bacterium]